MDVLFTAACVRLTDPRRFGALLWHDARKGEVAAHPLLAGLGIEPFDVRFDGAWLYRHTRARAASIKQVLLGGDVVVGVGNIYASESLFRARISPKRQARRIGLVRYEALATAIREVLTEAIAVGGSTLRDFVGADGADATSCSMHVSTTALGNHAVCARRQSSESCRDNALLSSVASVRSVAEDYRPNSHNNRGQLVRLGDCARG